MEPFVPRKSVVKPRRRNYKHRGITVVTDGIGLTEHGEIITDLIDFAMTSDPQIFITADPANLLHIMMQAHTPDFNYKVIDSIDTDHRISNPRVTSFGWKLSGKRKKPMHTLWSANDMTRDPSSLMEDGSPQALLGFAMDVRDFLKEQNIPIPSGLSGVGAGMLRDKRIYPNARGRVPHATNERARPLLPGVYAELRATTTQTYKTAIALDQRRAYHRVTQSVPLPDPSTLFARGYFQVQENAPIWCRPKDPLYQRTIDQPGLVLVRATSRNAHKNETRPPALNYVGTRDIYLWTNEIDIALDTGLQIEGLIAAWTSSLNDEGMPRYGKWAETAIDAASPYRAKWLKPTLHSTYGMMAARPRDLLVGHRLGKGRKTTVLIGPHQFNAHAITLENHSPPTNNVPALGMLQAEIRKRSMLKANYLMSEGVEVLHIHADGVHVAGALPLQDEKMWSIEPRTNLRYLDRVSWLADEGDTLPGRDQRKRIETRRHLANVLANRRR